MENDYGDGANGTAGDDEDDSNNGMVAVVMMSVMSMVVVMIEMEGKVVRMVMTVTEGIVIVVMMM